MRHEVGGRTPPSCKPVCFRVPLGQGVVGIGVGWGPGDGDSVVALYLVQEGIDTGDDLLVGNRFDGAGGKQFDTVKTVRYKIVTRCEGRVERLAPSTDPVQRMVKGAEFPRVASGSPNPIQSRPEGEVETASVITGFRIYYKTAKMINAVP